MGNALMTVCGAQSIINVCMRSIYHLSSISNKGFLNNSELWINVVTNISKFLQFSNNFLPGHLRLGTCLVVSLDNGFKFPPGWTKAGPLEWCSSQQLWHCRKQWPWNSHRRCLAVRTGRRRYKRPRFRSGPPLQYPGKALPHNIHPWQHHK